MHRMRETNKTKREKSGLYIRAKWIELYMFCIKERINIIYGHISYVTVTSVRLCTEMILDRFDVVKAFSSEQHQMKLDILLGFSMLLKMEIWTPVAQDLPRKIARKVQEHPLWNIGSNICLLSPEFLCAINEVIMNTVLYLLIHCVHSWSYPLWNFVNNLGQARCFWNNDISKCALKRLHYKW